MKTFANVGWTPDDVITLAPKMTLAEAEAWLAKNERHLRDRMIELGWDVIGALLAYDGVGTSDPEEEEVSS